MVFSASGIQIGLEHGSVVNLSVLSKKPAASKPAMQLHGKEEGTINKSFEADGCYFLGM